MVGEQEAVVDVVVDGNDFGGVLVVVVVDGDDCYVDKDEDDCKLIVLLWSVVDDLMLSGSTMVVSISSISNFCSSAGPSTKIHTLYLALVPGSQCNYSWYSQDPEKNKKLL